MGEIHDEDAAPGILPCFARAGHFATACGSRAVMAETYGCAVLKGAGGVAMVGDYGTAEGGEHAVLVSRGADASLTSGSGGIVFSTHPARALCVGDDGLVIAIKAVGSVITGQNAIVVLMDAGMAMIQVGANSLVIKRRGIGRNVDDVWYFVAMPGQAGLQDAKPGILRDDGMVDCDTDPEAYQRYLFDQDQELDSWLLRSLDQDFIKSVMDAVPAAALPEHSTSEPVTIAKRDGIDPASHPRKLILCNRSPSGARSAAGSLIATHWDAAPGSQDGIFGLLWGIGDPAAAGLGYGEDWALVAVPSYVITGPLDDRGHPRAVKFRAGIVIHEGLHGEILRKLIELGVEPDRLIGEVKSAGAGGHVEVGPHGAARAGEGGWAIASRNGQAEIGDSGFAEAGAYGFAKAGAGGIAVSEADGTSLAGPGGVAISHGKRYGTAIAGFEGLAVGDGRFKTVTASAGGTAVSTGHGSRVTAGDEGVAVGYGDIKAGRNGVAIALDGTVTGGEGCLLVGCIHLQNGTRRFVSAIAGQGGYLPNVRYSVQNGVLRTFVELAPE